MVIRRSLLWYEDTTHLTPTQPNTHTHTHTLVDRDGYTITGDRNQAVPLLSDQNVMMLWIPQIPKWSGLFLTIDNRCRQLPNSSLKWNKTKSTIRCRTHDVMQGKKESGSQMKGMQRKSEARDRGWICQSGDALQILTAFPLASVPICKPIYCVLTSETDKCLHRTAKLQTHVSKDDFQLIK